MSGKPTYEELLQKIKILETEKEELIRDINLRGIDSGAVKDTGEEELLESIIDIDEIQCIMDDFHSLTGMVTAIVDMKGKVIEKTGWQDICTKYHRVHPETSKNCTESDLFLVKNIKPGEYLEYKCKNGLWDVATPLYIGGRHMGNIYTGQFFYEDDLVDEKKFLGQALKYGFDKDEYLEAFRKIPVYKREEIASLMQFLVKFTSYISNVSYAKIKLEKEILVRKRVENELSDQKRRLDNILNGTNVGTWEWNIQTGETIFNERWADIAGYTLEELSPVSINTWKELCHPEDFKVSQKSLEECFERRSTFYEAECRIRHKDGSWVWVLDRGKISTWTKDGKPLWMFGTHQDISDRKKAEEEREKLQTQLTQSQKMESIGRLAGGVAHDFNNMLGVILGYSELAMHMVGSDSRLFSIMEEVKKAAERSASLTSQLLGFARKQAIAPKVTDINKIVTSLINMLKRIIGENIDLSWIPSENIGNVKIDPSQIDQILANLCVNARDAIDGVGKVTIETANTIFDEEYCRNNPGYIEGEYVMLAVSDNGCGMESSLFPNIFEPFFTTKEQGKGTGLGLATVYGVVKQNSGFINVYSEPGQGSTFKIYLPRHTGKALKEHKKICKKSNKGCGETILVVEDEISILKMTASMLENAGYRVITAKSIYEALSFASDQKDKIHLLLTDVVMPEMNGRDLSHKIREIFPDVKTLFMSGYTANVIAHHGVLDEGVNFIQKPFSEKTLFDKVRSVLDSD